MERALMVMIVYLLLIAGLVWLQINLSKKQNKWLGLIIPAIFLLLSIVALLSIITYTSIKETSSVTNMINGEIVRQDTIQNSVVKQNLSQTIISTFVGFITLNIPTFIFLAIYFAFRKEKKKDIELEKMNIQDL